MKIKLFLTSSLLVLGVWLAAAYVHTVDISSYVTEDNTQLQANLPTSETPTVESFTDQEEEPKLQATLAGQP
ncbi:hypothetical protein [Rubritalea tangerina]|uniref:Secreted protein n=1 Tax=Rubritalea tangerina TaxID=430798 RepID=A0ABW4ZDK8_9BACT